MSSTRSRGYQQYGGTGNLTLQDRLHILLSKLTETSNILEKWPDGKTQQQTSTSSTKNIHTETTTKLVDMLLQVVQALKNVEDKSLVQQQQSQSSSNNSSTTTPNKNHSNNSLDTTNKHKKDPDATLKKKLGEYQVPLDLLDLMDHGHENTAEQQLDPYNYFGLNPECFTRGLLREALRQLSGLQRRKVALEMLGKAIQTGMDDKEQKEKEEEEKEKEKQSKIMKDIENNTVMANKTKEEEVKENSSDDNNKQEEKANKPNKPKLKIKLSMKRSRPDDDVVEQEQPNKRR